jgi:secreted trypsin-like serine protease
MRAHKFVRGRLWATLLGALVAAVVVSLVGFVQSGEAVPVADAQIAEPLIASGKPVPDGKYPYMVSLHRTPDLGSTALAAPRSSPLDTFFCAGTLITKNHVLTAAHCVDSRHLTFPGQGPPVYDFEVVVGRTVLTNTNQGSVHSIQKGDLFIHPGWGNKFYNKGTYDVAVLKLKSAVTQRTIPLAPPSLNDMEIPGRPAIVAGWGFTNSTMKVSDRLQEVSLPIMSDANGEKLYPKYYDSPKQIAAGEAGTKGLCPGDSGGPLLGQAGSTYQIGIANYGGPTAKECKGGTINVFAEVNSDTGGTPTISDWIEDQMRK